MVDRGRFDLNKDVTFVHPTIRAQVFHDRVELLPDSFTPGVWDVICQGGKESYDHVGNRRFRVCIINHLKTYSNKKSKREKSQVLTNIVNLIRDSASLVGGKGFVRKDFSSGRWFDVSDSIAREKVRNALQRTKFSKPLRKLSDKQPVAYPATSMEWISTNEQNFDTVENAFPKVYPTPMKEDTSFCPVGDKPLVCSTGYCNTDLVLNAKTQYNIQSDISAEWKRLGDMISATLSNLEQY